MSRGCVLIPSCQPHSNLAILWSLTPKQADDVMIEFHIDERLKLSSIFVKDWPLSRVYMKDESQYPWFVLVPRVEGVQDIYELEQTQRYQLMDEISLLSTVITQQFKPDKLNVASLGNRVSQLHIHVVGRYKTDPLWPDSIWQTAFEPKPYSPEHLEDLILSLDF